MQSNGIDRLYGGSDADNLSGGAGDDQLFGGDDEATATTATLSITNGDFADQTLSEGVYGGAGSVTGWVADVHAQTFNPGTAQFENGLIPGGDENLVQINPSGFIEQEIPCKVEGILFGDTSFTKQGNFGCTLLDKLSVRNTRVIYVMYQRRKGTGKLRQRI